MEIFARYTALHLLIRYSSLIRGSGSNIHIGNNVKLFVPKLKL